MGGLAFLVAWFLFPAAFFIVDSWTGTLNALLIVAVVVVFGLIVAFRRVQRKERKRQRPSVVKRAGFFS